MSVLQRNYHWTDLEVHINPDRTRRRQRRIKNWINFRRPDSNNINKLLSFEETSETDQPTQNSAPNHWMGNYDFQYQLLNQPLQVFLGDSTTPTNTALWGMRRADNPRAWVNFKAIGGINNDVLMEVFGPQKAVRWQNLWDNSTLWLQAGRHKVTKQIRLSAPGHPASFKFVMRIPDGYSYEIANSQILIKDENGEVQLRTRPPYGWDSATVALSPIGQDVRVTLTETNPVTIGNKSFPSFLITPNADDLASAVYPVFIDPDTTIGAASIEDATILSTGIGNMGGLFYMNLGSYSPFSRYSRTLFRYQTADIPADLETVNQHRLDFYWFSNNGSGAYNALFHRILGTRPWVEGNGQSSGIPVEGACSNLYYVYDTDAWSSIACTHIGEDVASPSVVDSISPGQASTDTLFSFDLTNDGLDWPRGWVKGDYANEGMAIGEFGVNGTTVQTFHATEASGGDAQYRPSVFLDYGTTVPAPAGGSIFYGSNF